MATALNKPRPSRSSRDGGNVSSVSKVTIKRPKSASRHLIATVKFGTVTLTGERLSASEVKGKVKQGHRALAKAVSTLTKPGVRLKHGDHIPLFHADPKDPQRVIRVFKGKSETGRFVGSIFKPV